jgi:hypothetical protein
MKIRFAFIAAFAGAFLLTQIGEAGAQSSYTQIICAPTRVSTGYIYTCLPEQVTRTVDQQQALAAALAQLDAGIGGIDIFHPKIWFVTVKKPKRTNVRFIVR